VDPSGGVAVQADLGEASLDALGALRGSDLLQPRAVVQEIADRERPRAGRRLGQEGDPTSDRPPAGAFGEIVAGDQDPPGDRFEQPADRAEHGGLPGAVLTPEQGQATAFEGQVDLVDDDAVPTLQGDAVERDQRGRRGGGQ